MTISKPAPGKEAELPQEGDLRVWWIPQVPMKPFYVLVQNVREACLLLDALAEYDLFQFAKRIKPDYRAGPRKPRFSKLGMNEPIPCLYRALTLSL